MTPQQQAAWDAAVLALADAQMELWGAYFRETDEFLREKMKAARTKCIEAGVMMRDSTSAPRGTPPPPRRGNPDISSQ